MARGYITRLAGAWFILSMGFLMALAGFMVGNFLWCLLGTIQTAIGAALVCYTEMRRLTDRLGQ